MFHKRTILLIFEVEFTECVVQAKMSKHRRWCVGDLERNAEELKEYIIHVFVMHGTLSHGLSTFQEESTFAI